jgi:hypothetical protein
VVCLSTGYGVAGYPWCNKNTANSLPVSIYIGSDDLIPRGGADLQSQIPKPASNDSSHEQEDATLACTIGMYIRPGKMGFENGTQLLIMSQVFMASNTPRITAFDLGETKTYNIYNEIYPLGICMPSSFDSCRRHGWHGFSVSKGLGIIGGLLPMLIGTLLL